MMREVNLKDEFKKVIESDWDDVQVSVDAMRQIRKEEWYIALKEYQMQFIEDALYKGILEDN